MPFANIKSHNDRGGNGCPECYRQCREEKDAPLRLAYLAKKPEYIELLSSYDGKQGKGNAKTSMDHVHFLNTDCGHDFWTIPTDVFNRRVICPVCGDAKRTTKRNINNMLRKVHDPESWKRYQNDCAYMSDKVFNANQEILNPNGYIRTLAGVPGGYQLDHILPKAIGYKLDIPPALISHIDNLQMLPWEENREHSATIKYIPLIFREYFANTETTQEES